jgi:hypothetical protein
MRDTAADEAAQSRSLHLDALVSELMLEKYLLKQAQKVPFLIFCLIYFLSLQSHFPVSRFSLLALPMAFMHTSLSITALNLCKRP